MTLQQGHAGQHVLQSREQVPAADIGEIMGGQVGQQRHPHVGGGGAMRGDGHRLFLDVVRRQPVVRRPDQVLEECPVPPGLLAQEASLACSGLERRRCRWLAQPPGKCGGHRPGEQEGCSDHQSQRLHDQQDEQAGGQRWAYPHEAVQPG